MSWADAFAIGVANVFSWPGVLIPVAGTLLAMIPSFLPGVGNASLVVLVMAATATWDPLSVLLMFGALTGGATFMGSITAILFNIPGNVSSTPTLLDGHPMARQGWPRTAIACAATASATGSIFGVLVLLAALPVVRPLLLQFGPPERLLIGVWGLVTIASVPTTSRLKAAAMTALGLLAAAVGADPATGAPRWTFGDSDMSQGINVVAMMLGMFTFAELIEWMRSFRLERSFSAAAPEDSTGRGVRAVFQHWRLVLRASSIGTLVGMIPGVGGTVASFVAYGHAVQSAADKSRFGQGDIRGVIAPEAAVDAKDGGSLLPAIAFGLPGSEAGVALITVFAMHGIVPGPAMLDAQLHLTFTLIFALLLSNLLTSVVGVALTPALARLRDLPIERIALPCFVVSLVTVVELNGLLFDLYTAAAFGVAGYYWRTHGWPRAPFVIAFALGSLVETNLSLTAQLVQLGRVDLLGRAACIVLALAIVGSLAWMHAHRSRVRRDAERLPADVCIGALSALFTGALLAVAVAHAESYSYYAIVLAALACVLAAAAAVRAWRREPPLRGWIAAGLAVPHHHRLPLAFTVAMPLLIWLLGLAGGVGLAVAGWYAARSDRSIRAWLRAIAIALAYTLATWYFAEEFANLILPRGALWRLALPP
ncbi:MAG TPA: tripartite tricarboxylate transporter permease [Ramlibacter sp.]|uniref:tripartite tricarboxylate transporter permease n=1 Tax=Ramlibacter sp. TaxID=1917967 RepID=UPI002C6AB6BF|nr:tripartite tricarboxylate transporter permease [Ramlibacter sp.]HVZ43458.1 tripartite tricarboxylate transporter permease [Ramlibacter sp.]